MSKNIIKRNQRPKNIIKNNIMDFIVDSECYIYI
jgi:hypothetical protein